MKNYNPKEDNVVIDFTEELKKQIPSYLKNVALYGSRARGDNKKYSDYDFMVLLKEKNESSMISDMAF